MTRQGYYKGRGLKIPLMRKRHGVVYHLWINEKQERAFSAPVGRKILADLSWGGYDAVMVEVSKKKQLYSIYTE